MSDAVDTGRRQFLMAATTVTGTVGVVLAAVPFMASWKPSARAQAAGAPVEIDISKLEIGAMLKVEWRGNPVWVLRRTQAMLDMLPGLDSQLRDPDSDEAQQPEYATNTPRSIRPEILVMVGLCTHLGCSPTAHLETGGDLGADWMGGFYCPCHGSKFDLAGRVYKGVPAPLNMPVPPHRFLSESLILVGSDTGAA